jgi:TM2 domain-containing membrane protein YozV
MSEQYPDHAQNKGTRPSPYGPQGPDAHLQGQPAPQPYPQQYPQAQPQQGGQGYAPQSYPLPHHQVVVQRQPKSRVAAGLFGIFLGGLGIHRFYLGYTAIGLIQLLGCLFLGLFSLGILSFAIGIWGFIEGILILARTDYFRVDAHGIPLND